jgi:hypothetical protein
MREICSLHNPRQVTRSAPEQTRREIVAFDKQNATVATFNNRLVFLDGEVWSVSEDGCLLPL